MPEEVKPEPREDAIPQHAPSEAAEHDWNKNIDGSDTNTQRESEMRTSFSFTDNYAEGPEFSGRINSERHLDEKTGKSSDFEPLKGSIAKTVEKAERA